MRPDEVASAAAKANAVTEKARRVHADLSPDGQRLLDKLTKQATTREKIPIRRIPTAPSGDRLTRLAQSMADRAYRTRNGKTVYASARPTYYGQSVALTLASKQATNIELIDARLRQGFEYLAERDRIADERDRIADEREAAMLEIARRSLLVGIVGVAVAVLCLAAAIAALVFG